jgi:RHS repeat-associated protein
MRKTLLLLAALVPVIASGQSTDQNYVRTKTYKVPTSTTNTSPTPAQAAQSITYFDGLGRPIEQVAHKQAGNGYDIVTPVTYDRYGRQPKEYLPVVSGQTLNYHAVDSAAVVGYYSSVTDPTSNPYSEKLFEASPLNRILKQAAPGDDWHMGAGHEVRMDYQANVAASNPEEVIPFAANATWNSSDELYDIALTSSIGAGSEKYANELLYVTITKNENWTSGKNNTTEEYKDKEGHLILKRTFNLIGTSTVPHDTYYAYDQYGNLTYVIPPMVTGPAVTQTMLDDMCYQYKYDSRNRLVEKKLPGKQWEFIVYNSQDKPVATGPVLNPWGTGDEGWLITKYDAFGRVVYTGWYNGIIPKAEGRTAYQGLMAVENDWAEVFDNGKPTTIDDVVVSYTNDVYPTEFKLLTVNYYDSYANALNATVPPYIEGQAVSENVRSLATANWVRVLTSPAETLAETTVFYYDSKGRVIGTRKVNHLGGHTDIDTKLDFTGKTETTANRHAYDGVGDELSVTDMFTYTDQDRLLVHSHKIMGFDEELLAKNDYDDLGQLISKQVGGEDLSTYFGLQKVNYRYNIRGWLTDINDVNYLSIGSDPDDLFAFRINYNKPDTNSNAASVPALYNGNISETFWRSGSDNILRKYGYEYDYLNRLNNSIYQKETSTLQITHMYNEQMDYDKNGNLQHLNRNGDFDADDTQLPLQIDQLEYEYDTSKKNQLLLVRDVSEVTVGFKDDNPNGNDSTTDFTYDAFGNMKSDTNKAIDSISYNHLNLPTEIYFAGGDKIKYLYNALGQKVRKTVTDSSGDVVTDYQDGYQYSNGILSFFPHAEGYVRATYCGECQENFRYKYSYVFNYLDHLGNIRVSYGVDPETEELKILEENHYYPFGLKHTNYNSDIKDFKKGEENPEVLKIKPVADGGIYNYKYNGKEYQDELGLNMYDYGARNYDPAIGRWMNIDPLAEKYFGASPYNYVLNSPVNSIDPDGMDRYLINDAGESILALQEDKPDMLFAVGNQKIKNATLSNISDTNKDGKQDDKDGITVKSKGLLGQLTSIRGGSEKNIKGGYFSSIGEQSAQHEEDYQNLFKYVSDNTKTEFSLTFFKDNNKDFIQLSTFHDTGEAPSPYNLGIKDPNKNVSRHYHSHPGISANRNSEIFSIQGNTGDSDYGHSYYGNRTYPNYIYFPNSSKLYNVTPTTINYIKSINKGSDLKN